jgi:hypothetical protein
MSRWSRAAAWLVVAGFVFAGRPLAAQSVSLSIAALKADSMSPAPSISVTGVQNRPDLGPYTVSLELSTEAAFARPFYANADSGETATFTIDSLIPERTRVFMRARLIDSSGRVVADERQSHVVQAWVRLIEPAQQNLVNLPTPRPRFTWTSPAIALAAGTWSYDLTVINAATGEVTQLALDRGDTTFMFTDSLEANTPYRWQVRARAKNSRGTGEVTVKSTGTIAFSSVANTVFYQNFPNPFGRGTMSASTCFWFDLGHASTVRLTVYDLRLRPVRRIVPGPIGDGKLTVGTYGRGDITTQSGCDARFEWDGSDDAGHAVPPGVYVAVFEADGTRFTRKLLYKGR